MCFLFDVIFIIENRVRLGEILKRFNDQKHFSKLYVLKEDKVIFHRVLWKLTLNGTKKGVSLWIFLKLSTYNFIFSYENLKFVFKFVYNLGIIQAKVNHSVSRTFIFSLIIIFVILIKCKKFLKNITYFCILLFNSKGRVIRYLEILLSWDLNVNQN